MNEIRLRRPDDLHLHLRDGDALNSVVLDTARQFARAIIMPNLAPPVVSVGQALSYRQRVLDVLPDDSDFEPLMTLYLTDNTSPDDVERAASSDYVHAIKLYPAGATTNSAAGVTDIARVYPALAAMQDCGLPLLIHGELTAADIDVFDREALFIEQVLAPLLDRFPRLRVVLEHITTAAAANFVRQGEARLAATITAHHLLDNRNAMFQGGMRPHYYCLPILKRETDRQALVQAATGGESCFFLGTDSAPHARQRKESACGCAGIYTAHTALELYAEVFAEAGALHRLEDFASRFGADYYGLPLNSGSVELVREDWQVPAVLAFANDEQLVPYRAGQQCRWRLVTRDD